jgi:hypothetical protein
MLAPLVVLWLGSAQASPAQRAQLASWAAERGARAELASAPNEIPYDSRVVEQIEAAIENARAAAESASDELARAEQLLLAHPELPQAAWLLAERHALAAQAQAHGGPRPETGLARARALEGVRAAAAGAPETSPGEPGAPPAIPLVQLALPHRRAGDALFIDGLLAGERTLAVGLHHVRITRGARLVWAGWVVAGADGRPHAADPTVACSALDLADVEPDTERPRAGPGVACPRWAAARPGVLGGLDVSPCNGSSCAAWQHLGAGPPPGAEHPAALGEPRGWPGWLTWALVGAGAAATTGVVLWQAGAFERTAPSTEFVFTGPSAAAYRF